MSMKQLQLFSPTSFLSSLFLCYIFGACQNEPKDNSLTDENQQLRPWVITEKVKHDTDDPAIWVHPSDKSLSLIIGTDKKSDGALYVFDLNGKIIDSLTVRNIDRPNNVDVGYGFHLGDSKIDFAVTTERNQHRLRFFSLPNMQEIDGGGIEVFIGETEEDFRDLMGVSIYFDEESAKHYVIVGRKNGPQDGTYLWQYEMKVSADGKLNLELVRKFGHFSGKKEIEAIAVDSEFGYIYYSDEGYGVRKYHAHPDKGNEELALFATENFSQDQEGISIYKLNDGTGYILVSDQKANRFHIFPREGSTSNPHEHTLIKIVDMSTLESDGSEVTSLSLNEDFQGGLFVAMSTDKTFHFYRWVDIAGDDLKIAGSELSESKSKDQVNSESL